MSATGEEDSKTDPVQEENKSSEELFQDVENYPWDTDLEFQVHEDYLGEQGIMLTRTSGWTSSNPRYIIESESDPATHTPGPNILLRKEVFNANRFRCVQDLEGGSN